MSEQKWSERLEELAHGAHDDIDPRGSIALVYWAALKAFVDELQSAGKPLTQDYPGDHTEGRPFNEDTDCPACGCPLEEGDANEAFCVSCRRSRRSDAYIRGSEAAEAEGEAEMFKWQSELAEVLSVKLGEDMDNDWESLIGRAAAARKRELLLESALSSAQEVRDEHARGEREAKSRISELEAQLADREGLQIDKLSEDLTTLNSQYDSLNIELIRCKLERDSLRGRVAAWEATAADGLLVARRLWEVGNVRQLPELDDKVIAERHIVELLAITGVPTNDEAREVVERLGIDIPHWAAQIRAKVAASLPAPEPQGPFGTLEGRIHIEKGAVRPAVSVKVGRTVPAGEPQAASSIPPPPVAPEPAEPVITSADSDDAADAREQSAQDAVNDARPRFIQEILYYVGMMLDEDWPSHSLGHIEQAAKEFRLLLERQSRIASGEEAGESSAFEPCKVCGSTGCALTEEECRAVCDEHSAASAQADPDECEHIMLTSDGVCVRCGTSLSIAESAPKRARPHLIAEREHHVSQCACVLVEPCSSNCTCANHMFSGGCFRCASYGSEEQQLATAKFVAERIPSHKPKAKAQAQVEPEQPKACAHSEAIRDCAGSGWRCECGATGVGCGVNAPAPDVERALGILRHALTCELNRSGSVNVELAIRALGGTP